MIGRPVLEPRAFLPTINVAALLFIAPCLACYEFYSKGAPMVARVAPAVAPYSPSVQEELNKLMGPGRDPLVLRALQPLAAVLDWQKQPRMWTDLSRATFPDAPK